VEPDEFGKFSKLVRVHQLLALKLHKAAKSLGMCTFTVGYAHMYIFTEENVQF
jgi:hypothetical protein